MTTPGLTLNNVRMFRSESNLQVFGDCVLVSQPFFFWITLPVVTNHFRYVRFMYNGAGSNCLL
jgi:hypothetical protein